MLIRLPRQQYRNAETPRAILYASDLHIGSATMDLSLLRADLEWARQHQAIILFAGDVLDLILPKDHRRYTPARLCPELRGSDAPINAAVNLAERILSPYADLIHVMGCGNHETAAVKHHSLDVTALLVERLTAAAQAKRTGHRVHHGAYGGAIVIPYSRVGGGGGVNWRIVYHHGHGGNAPVTHGLISFNRQAVQWGDADVLWQGHRHHHYAHEAVQWRIPQHGSKLQPRTQWYVQTGSYEEQDTAQLDCDGCYISDYPTENGMGPTGRGGIRMMLTIFGSQPKLVSRVEICSSC